MKLVNIKPPQIAWVLLGVSAGLHFSFPQSHRHDFACWGCGIVGVAIGFGLMMWAWWLFRRSDSAIRPTDRATALVTSGPFRFSRNPMYLGMAVMLLGIAIWVGSLPMLIAPVGFFVSMSLIFIPYEEKRLREAFGEDYASYTRRVRRWLTGMSRDAATAGWNQRCSLLGSWPRPETRGVANAFQASGRSYLFDFSISLR